MITPKKIHFVYIIEGDKEPFLSLRDYLAIKSARVINVGYEICFHANVPFKGEFWNKLSGEVTFCQIEEVDLDRLSHVTRVEHKSDILRLWIIYAYGGIYLDLDTVCVKPFDDLLSDKPVMGREGEYGLCNAVIISPAKSEFIRKWLDVYNEFHNEQWNYFSVIVPKQLWEQENDLVKVLPESCFFIPSFDERGLEDLFTRKIDTRNNYILHLWGNISKKYSHYLTRELIENKKSTYTDLTRPYIDISSNEDYGPFRYYKSNIIASMLAENSYAFRGPGNDISNNYELLHYINNFIRINNINYVVDFSLNNEFIYNFEKCSVSYFSYSDTSCETFDIPSGDLLIVNYALQHFSNDHIVLFRDKIISKFRYCIITNSFETIGYNSSIDIKDGEFRPLDLLSEPYLFPGSYVLSFYCKGENIRTVLIAR